MEGLLVGNNLNDLIQFLYKLNDIRINYLCRDEFTIEYTIKKLNSNIQSIITIKSNRINSIKYYTEEDDTEINEALLQDMKDIVELIINFSTCNSNEN